MADITPTIREILETSLTNISGVPRVAWEAREFVPTTSEPYIKANFLPTIRRAVCLGPSPQHYYQGLLILTCRTKTNEGPTELDNIASSIINTFDTTTVHTNGSQDVQIRMAERDQGITEDSWHKTNVTISWFAYD